MANEDITSKVISTDVINDCNLDNYIYPCLWDLYSHFQNEITGVDNEIN